MDLVETGTGIGMDQCTRILHCQFGRLLLPGIRTEVIAAKDQAFTRESVGIGQAFHVSAKLRRSHAGVAAKLIDLVGGGFDQQGRVITPGNLHGGEQHLLVAATHAVETAALALAMGLDE